MYSLSKFNFQDVCVFVNTVIVQLTLSNITYRESNSWAVFLLRNRESNSSALFLFLVVLSVYYTRAGSEKYFGTEGGESI